VADLVRAAGRTFIDAAVSGSPGNTSKVLRAIATLSHAALGGHLDECTRRGYRPAIYKQDAGTGNAESVKPTLHHWLEQRRKELLPTATSMVFTLPMSWRRPGLSRGPPAEQKICTICCCRPVPKPSSKSLAIPNISAPNRLLQVFFFFCVTLESGNSNITHMQLCGVRRRDLSRPITRVGFIALSLLFPIRLIRRVGFSPLSCIALKRNFVRANLGFHGI